MKYSGLLGFSILTIYMASNITISGLTLKDFLRLLPTKMLIQGRRKSPKRRRAYVNIPFED